ncbi:sugar phosphate isomerase/epimerase family protein [Compostibacter hankyongensis]|uniref:Xylose isomerase-like TIM barrel domain-containing protein n=1 Tax=Compostibacter hankyongensis TaxID=1007089 RepID=A0ABP8FJA6_9BACT
MSKQQNHTRRNFIKMGLLGTAGLGLNRVTLGSPSFAGAENSAKRLPYKIGMRQASIPDPARPGKNMVANFDTFRVARDLKDICGVELQVASGKPNMRDMDVVRRYKAESNKWGLPVPSTAGVWTGAPWGPDAAAQLTSSIQATELLGATNMLVAFFGKSAPDMSDENAYGPVVEILQKAAPRAADAGIILGLENSLSPADNKKLVDLVGSPNVQVYYDLENMYDFGHGAEAVPGIKLLGKERLAAIHVKNKGKLISHNWRIDWAKAFEALTEIQYEGWLTFETAQDSFAQCVTETAENIRFLKKHFQPPAVS